MLNRFPNMSSTKAVLRNLGTGLMQAGGIYKITEGLLKLTSDVFLEDEIGANTGTRLFFAAVLVLAVSGLAYRSHQTEKKTEDRIARLEQLLMSTDEPTLEVALLDNEMSRNGLTS